MLSGLPVRVEGLGSASAAIRCVGVCSPNRACHTGREVSVAESPPLAVRVGLEAEEGFLVGAGEDDARWREW